MRGFLRVVDDLKRALEAVPPSEKQSSLREGIEITLKEFYRLLKDEVIEAQRCGYRLGEHLLRPAQVVVNEARTRDRGNQSGLDRDQPTNHEATTKGANG